MAVDPATAFRLFTDEIDEWYRSGHHSWNDPERAVGIRFERGVGGRWLEIWDEATGEGFEIGRVLVWEPGERLVVSYRNVHLPPALSQVEVRFVAVAGGTRVRLKHSGLEEPSERFRDRAWVTFLGWFRDYVAETSS